MHSHRWDSLQNQTCDPAIQVPKQFQVETKLYSTFQGLDQYISDFHLQLTSLWDQLSSAAVLVSCLSSIVYRVY